MVRSPIAVILSEDETNSVQQLGDNDIERDLFEVTIGE